EGNTSWDNGNVLQFPNEDQHEVTVTNCVFANNITKADNSPDRMIETRRNSKFVNCTFVGNIQEDQDLIYNNADAADGDHDGTDDETADVTQVVNCIFANNVVGNGDDVLGSRNASFTIAATNCLFFGNTLQNGNAADNTQRPADEMGSVLSDPLLDADLVPGAGSEAIDGGVDPATVGVTLTTDYNGNERPKGAAYDIGAHESE
ncbi:MAG: choice-of-anchor Q domain-containing protein, partial [Planctomycetota bacterium]